MTPQQKALELVDKYRGLVISAPYTDSEDGSCIAETMMLTRSAKQCALIAVDEALDALIMESNIYGSDMIKVLNYYEDVKSELQLII